MRTMKEVTKTTPTNLQSFLEYTRERGRQSFFRKSASENDPTTLFTRQRYAADDPLSVGEKIRRVTTLPMCKVPSGP